MIGEERPIGIKLTNPGNIDWYYGSGNTAYNSIEDAFLTVPEPLRLGKTVAIKTGDTIVEYWFASGTTDNDLVLKGEMPDLSGYQPAGDYVSASTLNNYYTIEEADTKFLTGFTVDLSGYQLLNEKDAANGYAGLNSSGLLPLSLFPDKLLGNVKYKGTYDGETVTSADNELNGFPLPTADNDNNGYYFISTSGYTYSGITYQVGDWIISDGLAGWSKVENSDAVTTVFGRNGNIVANAGDYSAFYLQLTGGTVSGDILPSTNLSINLGSPSLNFNIIRAQQLTYAQGSLQLNSSAPNGTILFKTNSVTNMGMFSNGNILMQSGGTYTDDGVNKLQVSGSIKATSINLLGTTEQLRLSYDATNFSSFTTSAGGNLSIGTQGGTVSFGSNNVSAPNLNSSTIISFNPNSSLNIQTGSRNFTAAGNVLRLATGTYSNTTGQLTAVNIAPIYSQSTGGTASATDLLINRTETSLGTGAQLLADFQVSGTSRFKVDNTGAVTFTGNISNGSNFNWDNTNLNLNIGNNSGDISGSGAVSMTLGKGSTGTRTQLNLQGNQSATNAVISQIAAYLASTKIGTISFTKTNSTTSGNILFQTASSGILSTQMTLDSAGNLNLNGGGDFITSAIPNYTTGNYNHIIRNSTSGRFESISTGDTYFDVKYGTDEWVGAAQFLGSPIKGTTIGIDPTNTAGAGNYNLESGRFYGQIIKVASNTVLSGVSFMLTATGAYTATGENRVGLYTYNQTGVLTLVASSTNNGNLYKGTAGIYLQEPFTTPYTATAGYYFVGFTYSSSGETTTPSLMGVPYSNTGKLTPLTTNSARMAYESTTASNTTLLSSITFSTITKDHNKAFWAGVY